MAEEKLTEGLNDRPKNAPIGQTAGGIPDDSGEPLEVDEETFQAIAQKLLGDQQKKEPEESDGQTS